MSRRGIVCTVCLTSGYCADTLHFTATDSQRAFRFRYESNAGRLLVRGRSGVWKRKAWSESRVQQ